MAIVKDLLVLGQTNCIGDVQASEFIEGGVPLIAKYLTSATTNMSNYATSANVVNSLSNKVDKVNGKGLSTNDYTTDEKNKLAGIAAGAEVNVQSDWNATSGDALILNKPTIVTSANVVTALSNKVDKVTGKGLSTNDYTAAEKTKLGNLTATIATTGASGYMSSAMVTKLNGIAAGAEVNVQSDWNATSGDALILNKPTKLSQFTNDSGFITSGVTAMTNYATSANVVTALNKKPDVAFKTITVGSTNIVADSSADTLTITAGDNITLTPNSSNDGITIAATNTTYTAGTASPKNVASTSAVGTSVKYAREDHQHKIEVATGDANGQVKIAGQNVSVAGLGSAAYTSSGTYATASHNQALSTITGADDLKAIEDLTGTSGLLKKTAANTWSLDTNKYIISGNVVTALSNKVDKVNGKDLSTNDYTTDDKNKLAGIAAGAEVNVQSDWNATSGDALILNKPTIITSANVVTALSNKVDKVNGKGLSTKDYTAAEQTKLGNLTATIATTAASGYMSSAMVTKLNGIASRAEVNQKAFSNVKIGSSTIAADSKTDTIELVAGDNITLTPDTTNDKITIGVTNSNVGTKIIMRNWSN
jgi:hypothetical protein